MSAGDHTVTTKSNVCGLLAHISFVQYLKRFSYDGFLIIMFFAPNFSLFSSVFSTYLGFSDLSSGTVSVDTSGSIHTILRAPI
jgi:hypothetical protein